MTRILVSPLSALPDVIRQFRPSHLVTLLGPDYMIETPAGIESGSHLRLAVDDVVESWAGESPPGEEHVWRLLAFSRKWKGDAPMLVHCWAGVSRSMAAAYTILCDRTGPGRELEVAQSIRARAPHADPNRLIVRLADMILGRGGSMVAAIESIGRGRLVAEGVPVELPLIASSSESRP